MRAVFLALAMALLWQAPAAAESGRRMLGAEAQERWRAVGRLNLAGQGFCTAALVRPDLAVTAAHCLYHRRTGKMLRPGSIHFVAGYRKGEHAGHRRVERIIADPRSRFSRKARFDGIASDFAVVKLERPMTAEEATPLAAGAGLDRGEIVTVLSYSRDRPEIASLERDCVAESILRGVALLACDTTFGVSGAPVIRVVDGQRIVVGVISAMVDTDGAPKAFAVLVSDAMAVALSRGE